MRHPHGLRAAAVSAIVLPALGTSMEGGFFTGAISHTANGVATHLLIIAPRDTGASGSFYPISNDLAWKTSNTSTAGTTSDFDGAANSANMNDASHPAAQFCENLTIGIYSDWYLPARYELDIAYQNLKPTNSSNNVSWGINPYSVPERTVNRTSGTPSITGVSGFRILFNGAIVEAEAFSTQRHRSSTEDSATNAWNVDFSNGEIVSIAKETTASVRAFRKVAV